MGRKTYLLIGEGYTDIGASIDWETIGPNATMSDLPDFDWSDDFHGGALREITLRCFEMRKIPRQAVEILAIPVSHIRKHGGGYPGKLKASIVLAEERGLDGVIFVLDRDREKNRLVELKAGREELKGTMPSAIGVCIETLEAWLLADHQSVADTLGIETKHVPAKPEGLAGEKGTASHPKDVLEHLIEIAPAGAKDVYNELARVADLQTIAQKCPKGFGEFQAELDRLLFFD